MSLIHTEWRLDSLQCNHFVECSMIFCPNLVRRSKEHRRIINPLRKVLLPCLFRAGHKHTDTAGRDFPGGGKDKSKKPGNHERPPSRDLDGAGIEPVAGCDLVDVSAEDLPHAVHDRRGRGTAAAVAGRGLLGEPSRRPVGGQGFLLTTPPPEGFELTQPSVGGIPLGELCGQWAVGKKTPLRLLMGRFSLPDG